MAEPKWPTPSEVPKSSQGEPGIARLRARQESPGFKEGTETQEVLQKIDFTLLRELFEKRARKAGIEPGGINFVEREGISDKGIGAAYNSVEDSLTINGRAIIEWNTEAARVLTEVCHEETHASGHNDVQDEIGDILLQGVENRRLIIKSGVAEIEEQQSNKKVVSKSTKFRWFNEGITDELGFEIFCEYIQTQPLHDPKTGKKTEPEDYISGYPLARLFVRKLTERIAEQYGVSYDVAWGSVVHAYMTGTSFSSEEIRPLLDDVFHEKFADRLERVNRNNDVISLSQVMRLFSDVYQISPSATFSGIWESFRRSTPS